VLLIDNRMKEDKRPKRFRGKGALKSQHRELATHGESGGPEKSEGG